MAYQFIEVEQKEGILTISLTDPRTRNALGDEMGNEIFAELDRFENDPECRVLVLTGKDPAFCSGANVRFFDKSIKAQEEQTAKVEPQPRPWEQIDPRHDRTAEVSGVRSLPLRINKLQKPSIAAVNGHAYGIGMGLALSCDIRIASDKARFSEAFIRNGLIPADGSCWQLPRLIGLSNTLLMQYTGDALTGEDAFRLGICSKVVPHEELMKTAMELASRLAHGPTFAMSLIKYLVMESLSLTFEESMKLAGPVQELARKTEDHKEGVRAFLEKRPAEFKGR